MLMILIADNQKIILWGAIIREDIVTAEIGYFDAGISQFSILLSNKDKSRRAVVIVPENVKDMFMPGKAQNLTLEIKK